MGGVEYNVLGRNKYAVNEAFVETISAVAPKYAPDNKENWTK